MVTFKIAALVNPPLLSLQVSYASNRSWIPGKLLILILVLFEEASKHNNCNVPA